MDDRQTQGAVTKEDVLKDVVGILKDITSDFDTDYSGDIGSQTRLVADLGFESIDVVEMAVAIERHYQGKKFPFQKLFMQGGQYNEFSVSQLVDFLHQYLNA